jgi:hypothetical protein
MIGGSEGILLPYASFVENFAPFAFEKKAYFFAVDKNRRPRAGTPVFL